MKSHHGYDDRICRLQICPVSFTLLQTMNATRRNLISALGTLLICSHTLTGCKESGGDGTKIGDATTSPDQMKADPNLKLHSPAEKAMEEGNTQYFASQFELSIHSYERAAALIDREKASGDWVKAQTGIGRAIFVLGRFPESEKILKDALAFAGQKLGPSAPELPALLENLSDVISVQGKHAEAVTHARREVEIVEKNFGPDHLATARALVHLTHFPDVSDAEALLRRALAIDEKALGPDHDIVAGDLTELATVLQREKKNVEAGPPLRRALAIHEKLHGQGNAFVARDLYDLAEWLKAQGSLPEAEAVSQRCVEAFAMVKYRDGKEDSYYPSAVDNYRDILSAQKLPEDKIDFKVKDVIEAVMAKAKVVKPAMK